MGSVTAIDDVRRSRRPALLEGGGSQPLVAAVLALAAVAALLAAAPARAQAPGSAAIFAEDDAFRTASGGPADVTIAAGGHVDFSYFSGNSRHNVVFTAARPSVCGISEGPAGTTAALPEQPSPASWAGGCDFDTPGTYPFVCALHSSMTGSVTVVAASASGPPPPADVELAPGPAATSLRVRSSQRGFTVRGSVLVDRAGSRLRARALVRRRALYGGRSARLVEVGRTTRTRVGGARATFAVKLDAAARRALRRAGRLPVSLRLTVTPPHGRSYAATRTVILRAR
jgi:plastocyanin